MQRYTFYYNPDNYTDSVLYQIWDMREWKNYEKEDRIPDYQLRDSMITTYYWEDSTWTQTYNNVYFYDEHSPSYNVIYQFWNSSEWIDYYMYTYFYTPDYHFLGHVGEEWNDTTSVWIFDYRYSYEYSIEYHQTEYKYQKSFNGVTWNNVWRYTYGYDSAGNRTRELFQNWRTDWEDVHQKIYEYNSNGLLFLETVQVWSGSEWVNEYKYTYIWELLTGIDRFSNEIGYRLYNNYPNPFNPITKISWQAPVSSWQTLKVYDILGNEVATLVDEYKPAGSYEVEFDAIRLSSGVYFYQFKAGSFIETKKMVLMK